MDLRPAAVWKRVLNRGLTAKQSGSDCRLHQVRGGRGSGSYRRRSRQDQLYAEPSGAGISSRRSIAGRVCRAAMASSTMIWSGGACVGATAMAATSVRALSWSSIAGGVNGHVEVLTGGREKSPLRCG